MVCYSRCLAIIRYRLRRNVISTLFLLHQTANMNVNILRILNLQHLRGKATVYIDDLFMYSGTSKEARLEDVQGANAHVVSKRGFLQSSIDYHGHEVSTAGVKTVMANIKCVEEVQSQFLGLVSYFRKFARGFPVIAHLLNKLLKKMLPGNGHTSRRMHLSL